MVVQVDYNHFNQQWVSELNTVDINIHLMFLANVCLIVSARTTFISLTTGRSMRRLHKGKTFQ